MPIDASIYNALGVKPKSMMDYQNEYAQQDQNALALKAGQLQYQNALQGQEDMASTREATKGFGADQTANYNALLRTGNLKGAQDYLKTTQDSAKAAADVGHTKAQTAGLGLDQSIKAHEFHVQQLATVNTPQDALAWAQDGLNAGVFTPKQYQRGLQALQQASQTPEAFAKWKNDATMGGASATEQLKMQQDAQKQQEQVRQFGITSAETGRAHGETARANREREAIQVRGQDMTDGRMRDTNVTNKETLAAARKEAGNEKAVTKFADTLQREGIPDIEAALSGAEAVFAKFTDPKTGKLKGMPGIGAATNALPDWAVSSEGKDVRESLTAVSNLVLSARSGAAVTDQELRRLARELSDSVGASEADMQRAYGKFRTRFEKVKANLSAGASDEVKATYEDRGGIKIQRGGAAPAGAQAGDAKFLGFE
jgi:hypothetical protein